MTFGNQVAIFINASLSLPLLFKDGELYSETYHFTGTSYEIEGINILMCLLSVLFYTVLLWEQDSDWWDELF
jgi:hypothetical protein